MTMETYTEGSGQSAPPLPPPAPSAGGTDPPPPVTGAPDTLTPEPRRFPLPRLDFLLPDLEPGQIPDNQLPGMAEKLQNIMNTVPPEEVILRRMAVKSARQELNAQYHEAQRARQLARQEAQDLSDKTVKEYQGRMTKEVIPENQILTDQRLTPNGQWEVLTRQRAFSKEMPDPKTDTHNWRVLMDKVIAPYGTPGKILDRNEIIKWATDEDPETGKARLTPKLMEDALKHFDDQKNLETNHITNTTRKFVADSKTMVEGPAYMEPVDPGRGLRFFNFSQAMDNLVNQFIKDGKNPQDIYKQTDPKDEFSSPAGQVVKNYLPDLTKQTLQPPAPKGPDGKPLPPTPQPRTWNSPEEVKAELGRGSITREQALDILVRQFGYTLEPRAPMAR